MASMPGQLKRMAFILLGSKPNQLLVLRLALAKGSLRGGASIGPSTRPRFRDLGVEGFRV